MPNKYYAATGIPMGKHTLQDAVEVVLRTAAEGRALQVHLCNAYSLSLAHGDARLRRCLLNADLNLPDGKSVAVLAGRRHNAVRGPDLMRETLRSSCGRQIAHYLYGGGPDIAQRVEAKAREFAPGVLIAGIETPDYAPVDALGLPEVADRATASGASVLWVGLGTPKQDYAVPELARRFAGPVIPVGAAFDFLAGAVAESPRPLQNTGFEWAHRFLQEPGRLWQRYTFHSANYLRLVVAERLFSGREL